MTDLINSKRPAKERCFTVQDLNRDVTLSSRGWKSDLFIFRADKGTPRYLTVNEQSRDQAEIFHDTKDASQRVFSTVEEHKDVISKTEVSYQWSLTFRM
ncbi:unnamed protein product, partial [Brassica oleracea]